MTLLTTALGWLLAAWAVAIAIIVVSGLLMAICTPDERSDR